MKEFAIPIHPEDLLISGDRYCVEDTLDVDNLPPNALRKKLDGVLCIFFVIFTIIFSFISVKH
jgi:hypothetical protein